jgi:hypothetical protein
LGEKKGKKKKHWLGEVVLLFSFLFFKISEVGRAVG